MHNLNFEKLALYNIDDSGINVEVEIAFGDSTTKFEAKIDTGASSCIFERKFGEEIGIEIETGDMIRFSTATGAFLAYGHFVNLKLKKLNFIRMYSLQKMNILVEMSLAEQVGLTV